MPETGSAPVTISGPITLSRSFDTGGRAAALANYAFDQAAHGNATKFWHFTRNAVRDMYRYDKRAMANIGVGLAITAGVVIAGVATGGIAIGVLAGIAGGKYVLGKIIKHAKSRPNKDWLKNCSSAERQSAADWANALSTNATDGIRRAVDHFRKAEKSAQQLKLASTDGIGTCNDAIRLVSQMAEFIHESDKCRNYLLPTCDLVILILVQYIDMSQAWNTGQSIVFDNAVIKWINEGNHSGCKTCFKNYQSAPNRPGGTGGEKSLDAGKVLKFFQELTVEIEKAMRGHTKAKALTSQLAHAQEGRASDKRRNMLYEAAYKKADSAKALHKFTNAYTRSSATEKAFGLFAVLAEPAAAVGSLFVGDAEAISTVLKGVIKGGITTVETGTNIVGGVMSKVKLENRGKLMIDSVSKRETPKDIKDEGIAVENLIKKVANHYTSAAEYYGEIEKLGGTLVLNSCDAAIGLYAKIAEFTHYMDKMEDDLFKIMSVVVHLAERSIAWSKTEAEVWVELEKVVGKWIADPRGHEECVKNNCYCYGPKRRYNTVGGGFFSRGQKVLAGYDHWLPEKPF